MAVVNDAERLGAAAERGEEGQVSEAPTPDENPASPLLPWQRWVIRHALDVGAPAVVILCRRPDSTGKES
jgi:hypothetical protein